MFVDEEALGLVSYLSVFLFFLPTVNSVTIQSVNLAIERLELPLRQALLDWQDDRLRVVEIFLLAIERLEPCFLLGLWVGR